MKFIKTLFFYVVICGIISALIYYFTGNIVFSASIWVVYGAGLVLGKITDFIFSKLFSPLHGNALASIMVYFTVGVLVGAVDYYFMVPIIRGAVEYPFPLSFSVPLWIGYGIFLLFYLVTYYIRNRTCPNCRGITLRKGGYCHLCGFSLEHSKDKTEGSPIVESGQDSSAALESAAALENQESLQVPQQEAVQAPGQEVPQEPQQQEVPQEFQSEDLLLDSQQGEVLPEPQPEEGPQELQQKVLEEAPEEEDTKKS